jgi:hypothetical protein
VRADAVTLSTKAWEGDYRRLLRPDTLAALFGPFGAAAHRQVVLNNVTDRTSAQAVADVAIEAGALDAVVWAEDLWPAVADRLGVPQTWFGAAWAFAVPELVELEVAPTPIVAHLAGDVRLEPAGEPWLSRALDSLPGCIAVAPTSPSRIEWTRPEAGRPVDGWIENWDFSDQCFVARSADLLRPEVVRATHPVTGRYPKPGGALSFEARVGAWLRRSGQVRRIDQRQAYLHPVGAAPEGSAYPGLGGPVPPVQPAPRPGPNYPPVGTVPITALVAARDARPSLGWALASIAWASRIVVVDQDGDDEIARISAAYGAELRRSGHTVTGRAALPALAASIPGWLLIFHADEVMPPRVACALVAAVDLATTRDDVDGIELTRRGYIRGRAAGVDRQLRAVRSEVVTFPWGVEAVRAAPTLTPGARVKRLPDELAILRLRTPDLGALVLRANERTSLEARGTELSSLPSSVRAARAGWREWRRAGLAGLTGGERLQAAGLAAAERWLLAEKVHETVAGGAASVRASYDELAARILRGETI